MSANATPGNATTAAPIPNATAKAPTRPTEFEPDTDGRNPIRRAISTGLKATRSET